MIFEDNKLLVISKPRPLLSDKLLSRWVDFCITDLFLSGQRSFAKWNLKGRVAFAHLKSFFNSVLPPAWKPATNQPVNMSIGPTLNLLNCWALAKQASCQPAWATIRLGIVLQPRYSHACLLLGKLNLQTNSTNKYTFGQLRALVPVDNEGC